MRTLLHNHRCMAKEFSLAAGVTTWGQPLACWLLDWHVVIRSVSNMSDAALRTPSLSRIAVLFQRSYRMTLHSNVQM